MKFDFKRKVLKNGMTIIFEKRNLPVVSVAFAVRNGGINETADEKGISHFIEHMLYKGTASRTHQQITEEIEKNGGELNGFTDETITAYWCKMPSRHLNTALEVLGDMIKNPLFDERELEKEKKVILEEIKMNRDSPINYAIREIQTLLYEGTLGRWLIGDAKTLGAIDREKIMKKFVEIYQPNNLILCVVGDADFEEIVEFAEKNFKEGKGEISNQNIELMNKEKTEKRKGVDQANLVFAYHVPFGKDKKNYASQVLSALTAEGMSSRLFNEIREKRNLAYALKGSSEITKDFGYNLVYVGTSKENVGIVREIILKEFEKVAGGLEEDELNQVKEQLAGQFQINMEDSMSQMIGLLYSEINENAEDFYEYEKNVRNVKLEDVRTIAKSATEKFSFFALVPISSKH